MFTKPIINYSDLPNRRRTIQIGLGYGEEVERAIKETAEREGIDLPYPLQPDRLERL